MRVVLVAGARRWPEEDHTVWGVLSEQVREHGPFVLMHGGAPAGVDALAHEWLSIEDPVCDLPCCDLENQRLMRQLEELYPVDLRTDGIAGIPALNQRMVARRPDVCLAFLTPQSRGSVDCMTRARIAGIPVIEHRPEDVSRLLLPETLCCSNCVHPAIDHDQAGCHAYGDLDKCTCTGYGADPRELV